MTLRLNVYSEISRLREVLVHAPGPEVDSMTPSMMEELLFDDIVYGPGARLEHQRFRAVLESFGVRVRDVQDLLGEAIEAAPDAARGLLAELQELEGLGPELVEELGAMAPGPLSRALVEGLRAPPEEIEPEYLFRLAPLPNLLFVRDPQVVLAGGVVIGAMSRPARQREPLLSRFAFVHHPALKGAPIHADFLRRRPGRAWPQNAGSTFEGGDLLVFEEGVVVVGVSERTMERAVDSLAGVLRGMQRFRSLVMVPLPRQRSAMHLDTIFTRTSADECLVYAPMVLGGSPETLSVLRIELARPNDWGRRCPSLLEALAQDGVRLEPIACGGPDDYIQQAREQWTDGANSFAVAPGVVLLYSRNARTAEELSRRGYGVVAVNDLRFGEDGRCLYDFREGKKYAILVAGEELSRARGGPRCMTMPLVREGGG